MGSSNKHSFELMTFTSFTYCDVCSKLLWGVAKQGYTCTKCGINVHENCKNTNTECISNPDRNSNSSPNSPTGSKNALNNISLNLSSTSNIIKSLQANNIMMEASQKLQNTKTLVKDKIHHLNNSNELNNILSNQKAELSNNSLNKEILEELSKKEKENNKVTTSNTNSDNNNSTAGKLILLSDDDDDAYSSNTSELIRITNKKKKLLKKKISSDAKDTLSDSEEVLKNSNTDLVTHHIANDSNDDISDTLLFSDPEDSSKIGSPGVFRRRHHKDIEKNKDYSSDSQHSLNDIDTLDNNKSKKNSKKVSKKDSNISINNSELKENNGTNSSTEIVLNQTNGEIDDISNNKDNLEGSNSSSVPSISNFKTSELTEIIKESPSNANKDSKKKLLKSKPSQSEIFACSVVVTSNNNKSSSIESITEINSIEKKEKKCDNIEDNEKSKEKKDSVGFNLNEKNSSENSEHKKEYTQNNKKSKPMAALMKTNQVHSKLEQLLRSETFSFQNKLAEVENEPLSLFSTTPKNTIVFATKIGPVFDLQDKFMDILNWKNPSRSFSVYLIYSILCFKPNLILYIPIISVVLFLAYIYYKRETGKSNNNSEEKKGGIGKKDKEKEKEKIKDKDLKSNLNDLLSSLSVKQKANFNPNMVDMKTLQGNIQRLQNMMGSYCSAYDSVIEIWEKIKATNPLEIRKALFFALLALLGQILTLRFIRIGILFFIAGTFAFFPQFTVFIIWILTGWIKIALEFFNDIVMRKQNNRSNSKLHFIGKKFKKTISDNSSDSESNEYSTNSQRARLYSTIENNELKVQKSTNEGSSTQKVMEGKIFTAIVVENQRWWVGTGYTDLLLHKDPPNYSTNYKEPKEALPSSLDNYPLPPNYRFLPDESWEIEMEHGDEEGWIYMDNIWRNEGPRKITSYTRKRIWKRKASYYA